MENKTWSWALSGSLMAAVLLAAIVLVKPVGVSTQFVIADGIIWNAFDRALVTTDESSASGFASSNAYLNKSGGKYAKSVAKPINYSFIFVIAMIFGGFLGYLSLGKNKKDRIEIAPTSDRRGYGRAFFAGVLVLFGARLAGGCTSGHMMSGIMQTSISGFLFTAAVMTAGVPLAMMLYRGKTAQFEESQA